MTTPRPASCSSSTLAARDGRYPTADLSPTKPHPTSIASASPSIRKAPSRFTVRETKPVENQYALTNITDNEIAVFQRQKSINPELEAALRKIIEQKGAYRRS